MAAAMKASKVLPVAGALILPTIPKPQCVTCLQWNQIAVVEGMPVSLIAISECRFELTIGIGDIHGESGRSHEARVETTWGISSRIGCQVYAGRSE